MRETGEFQGILEINRDGQGRHPNFLKTGRTVLSRRGGSTPSASATGAHAKGAYKTPTRVSFSMQNKGKLPFPWQFTLFIVSSRITLETYSSSPISSFSALNISDNVIYCLFHRRDSDMRDFLHTPSCGYTTQHRTVRQAKHQPHPESEIYHCLVFLMSAIP